MTAKPFGTLLFAIAAAAPLHGATSSDVVYGFSNSSGLSASSTIVVAGGSLSIQPGDSSYGGTLTLGGYSETLGVSTVSSLVRSGSGQIILGGNSSWRGQPGQEVAPGTLSLPGIGSSISVSLDSGLTIDPAWNLISWTGGTLTLDGSLPNLTFSGNEWSGIVSVSSGTLLVSSGTLYTGSLNTTGASLSLSNYNPAGGFDVTLIPEPSAALLGVAGATVLLNRRRRS